MVRLAEGAVRLVHRAPRVLGQRRYQDNAFGFRERREFKLPDCNYF
jgi:hypothetical protein